MKRLSLVIFLALLISPYLRAQSEEDSLRYAESIWSMKKKAMILDQMELTEAEKSAFWPIYESYSNAIQYLEIESLRLLGYTTKKSDVSDKKAAVACEDLLANDVLLAKVRRQYFKKFKKALSPAQAGRFMQLDNNFRTMLRLQIQRESPAFVSSLNRYYSRN
jgi:hypothetical protein